MSRHCVSGETHAAETVLVGQVGTQTMKALRGRARFSFPAFPTEFEDPNLIGL